MTSNSSGTVDNSVQADYWSDLGAWARARRSPDELAKQCERVQGAPSNDYGRRRVDSMRKQDRLRQIEGLIERVRIDAKQLEDRQGEVCRQVDEVVEGIAAELAGGNRRRGAMADFVRQLADQAGRVQRDRLAQIREVADDIEAEVARDELAGSDAVMSLAVTALYQCLMELAWKLDAEGTKARLAAFTPAELDALDELGVVAASRAPVQVALFVLGRMTEALDRVRARKPATADVTREIAKLAVQLPHASAVQIKAAVAGSPAIQEVRRTVRQARAASPYRKPGLPRD